MNTSTEHLIYQYLDGTLPGKERRALEERIRQDEQFRDEVAFIRELQRREKSVLSYKAPVSLTANVMEAIQALPEETPSNVQRLSTNTPMYVFTGALAVLAAIVFFLPIDSSDSAPKSHTDLPQIKEWFDTLISWIPSFDFSFQKSFDFSITVDNNLVLIFTVSILLLLVFDKLVLKPLSRRS